VPLRPSIVSLLATMTLMGCPEASIEPGDAPSIESFAASSIELPVGGGDVDLSWVEHGGVELTIAPSVGSVTLSWTTTNADAVSIDQGVGDVTWEFGSTQVWVAQTTTFTLTATNGSGPSSQGSTAVFVE